MINVIKFVHKSNKLNNHKCNKLAKTSKSRGHKLAILIPHEIDLKFSIRPLTKQKYYLFLYKWRGYKLVILVVHFLLQDTGIVRQVSRNGLQTFRKYPYKVLGVGDIPSIWRSLRFSLRQDKFSQTSLYKFFPYIHLDLQNCALCFHVSMYLSQCYSPSSQCQASKVVFFFFFFIIMFFVIWKFVTFCLLLESTRSSSIPQSLKGWIDFFSYV